MDAISGDRSVHPAGRRQGRGCSRPPALADGPLPAHYEPQESPFRNPLYGQQRNPVRQIIRHRQNPYQPVRGPAGRRRVPVRGHHLPADRASHGGRHVPVAALPVGAAAGVLLRGLPGAGRRARAWSTAAGPRSSPRAAAIEARVLVTERIRPLRGAGPRGCTRSGCPTTGARNGMSTGDSANDLAHLSLDPNVHIQEVKALACDIRPGRRPRGARALRELRAGLPAAGAASPSDTGTEPERHRPDEHRPGRAAPATPITRRGWGSSPTPRCASAARPARWPARSGTRCPRTG